jgi:peptidoglycan/xylan/chitin deacetylase (PgdA/CDA1 family)
MDKKLFSVTVDVETDWGGRLSVSKENCRGIEEGIPWIISLFDNLNIKATFFISACVSSLYKGIIKEVSSRGHEIGSHGYDHKDYRKISREELEYQLKGSKDTLEEITNKEVAGFRSPQFKIHPCLYECLAKTGYLYDSSAKAAILSGRSLQRKMAGGQIFREIPISRIPATPHPFGLLWVNYLGIGAFSFLSKLACPLEDTVMYLHPFDIIAGKSKYRCPLHIRLWYSFREKKARGTFLNIVTYYKNMGFRFVTLRDYLNEKF